VIPLVSASWIAGITGMSHQCLAKPPLFIKKLNSEFYYSTELTKTISKWKNLHLNSNF
jgi:hypothetical protein